MSRADFRRRQSRRRRQKLARMSRHLPTLILLLAITVLVGGGIFALYRFVLAKQPDGTVQVIASSGQNGSPNPGTAPLIRTGAAIPTAIPTAAPAPLPAATHQTSLLPKFPRTTFPGSSPRLTVSPWGMIMTRRQSLSTPAAWTLMTPA